VRIAAPESARTGCLPRLHSYFVTEWKPDLPHRPEIGKIDFTLLTSGLDRHDAWLHSAGASFAHSGTHGARGRNNAAYGLLIDSQAKPAVLLCTAARECLFPGKILRDNFIRLRLVCPDNREGREKSALLRGQSLGRMRSRRGYSLPPETGNRSDAFKLQGLVPCIFFVQSPA